jgi:hypothetical protein
LRIFLLTAILVMVLSLPHQARGQAVGDSSEFYNLRLGDPALNEVAVIALANCSALWALLAKGAEQVRRDRELAERARVVSAAARIMASDIARLSGLPDNTAKYTSDASAAYMAKMGGQIENLTATVTPDEIDACQDVAEHGAETLKGLKRPR